MSGHRKSKSSSFEIIGKKPLSVSGRYVAPRTVLTAQDDLKALVSAQQSAVRSGGKAKVVPVARPPPLDPAVTTALKSLKRFASRPDRLEVLTEQMDRLDPALQAQLYGNLARDLRAFVEAHVARGRKLPPWLAAVLKAND